MAGAQLEFHAAGLWSRLLVSDGLERGEVNWHEERGIVDEWRMNARRRPHR